MIAIQLVRARTVAAGAFVLLTLFSVRPASAVPAFAVPDTAFGTNGDVVVTMGSTGSQANAVAVQSDGKIVVAGAVSSAATADDYAVVRLNADGTLDTGFGTGGGVTKDFSGLNDDAYAVVVQADGGIVVGGESTDGSSFKFKLIRYDSDGNVDTSFGSSGIVTTDPGGSGASLRALALQPDGKLVAAGYRYGGSPVTYDYVLARYNHDGSLDSGFGTNGLVITPLGNNNDYDVALALQADGKIVIASGYRTASMTDADFLIARYNADGSLDTSGFNAGAVGSPGAGLLAVDLQSGSDDYALGVAVQPDGGIVAAGRTTDGSHISSYGLVRANADGTVDTTFGTGGVAITDSNAFAHAVLVQPNGKIVAAGETNNGADSDFSMFRYDAAGAATGGAVLAVGSGGDVIRALAAQPDGGLVAAGFSTSGSRTDMAVARFTPDDAPWDVTPNAFKFTDDPDGTANGTSTSDMITISGLDSGVSVPVTVSGGEYAKNGSTTYTNAMGWASNGDQFNVRHTDGAAVGEMTSTVLSVGGVVAGNNHQVILGTRAMDTYSSTVASTSSGGGGGGAVGPWWLLGLLLAAFGARRVRR